MANLRAPLGFRRRRAGLLGAILGSGLALPDRHIGPPYYLINDTFSTDRASGAVNGTDAEPGPGRRGAIDTNSKLTLSGGVAAFATGGAGVGDPGIWYGEQSRAVGRMLKTLVTPANTNGSVIVGWDTNQLGAVNDSFRFGGSGVMAISPNSGSSITVGLYTAAAIGLAVIFRPAGCYFLAKPGSNWLLMWISSAGSTSRVWPALSTINTTTVYTADYIRVPSTLWLPTPLLSDGFSAWGTSDGLGHAEGIAGGLGSGGGGLAYTVTGTWGAAGGVASASALVSGVAVATVDSGKADNIVTAKLTRSAGVAGVTTRYVDANNNVQARYTGTNAQLVKLVAGVATTLVDTAATYVAGAEIRIICEGQKFRLFYNNVAIGAEQTIADAALASATVVGLRTTDTGNTFDDFTCYARGSGGEYAELDESLIDFDTFTAADSTTLTSRTPAPIAQAGKIYTTPNGTWQILSNTARVTAAGPTNYHGRLFLNTGFTDGDYEIEIAIPASGSYLAGIGVRNSSIVSHCVVVDSNSGSPRLAVTLYNEYVVAAGVNTILASVSLPGIGGTTIRLLAQLRSNNVYVFVDGVYKLQYNLLNYVPESTTQGLYNYIESPYQTVPFDNFRIWKMPHAIPTNDVADTTTAFSVMLPANFNPANIYNLIIYHHGLGELAGAIITDTLKTSLIADLVADGYIVADSTAYRDNFGNDAGQQAYYELYRYLTTEYRIGRVLALSQSAGGPSGLLCLLNARIPYAGWAGIYPVCNLANAFATASLKPSVKAAYAFTDDADYATATAGHDPMLFSPTAFALPMRFYASDGDTVVIRTENADSLAAYVEGYATENAVVVCSGGHGDPSHFQSADLRAFYARCLSGAAAPTLVGSTWAVDGNGRAYNTPTGTQLLSNVGLEAPYSGGTANGWVPLDVGTNSQETSIVHSGASAQKIVASIGAQGIQGPKFTANRWHITSAWLRLDSGTAVIRDYLTDFLNETISLANSTWTEYVYSSYATAANEIRYMSGSAGTSYWDDVSNIALSTPLLYATIQGGANDTAGIQIYSAGTKAHVGLVSKLDDPVNPQNMVKAYREGNNWKIAKVVGGTMTILQTIAATFVADSLAEIRWPTTTTVELWYGGSKISTTHTVNDIGAGTYYGMFSTRPNSLITQFWLDSEVMSFEF